MVAVIPRDSISNDVNSVLFRTDSIVNSVTYVIEKVYKEPSVTDHDFEI